MKRTLCTALCLLVLITAFLGGALQGFEQAALNPENYDRLQKQLNVYGYAGMDADALGRVNRLLADYLTGRADGLAIEEEIFGKRGQVFNESEKAHMVDVLHLFELAHALKTGLLLAAALLLAALLYAARPDGMTVLIRAGAWFVRGGAALLLTCVVLFGAFGFDRLFILFHELLFTNDLWLMNPATDVMVRMFPGEFFERIALQAGLSALAGGVCALAAVLLICGFTFHSTFGRKQIS